MEESKKQLKFADFGTKIGERGRPRKKTVESQDDWDRLTDQEKFQVLKAELIKDLKGKDLNPIPLKKMIEHRMEFATGKHHEWGEKLWGRLMIQRGKFREQEKDAGNCETTIFGSIKIHQFANGIQMELPIGYSLKPKRTKKVIEINDAIRAYELYNEIMM